MTLALLAAACAEPVDDARSTGGEVALDVPAADVPAVFVPVSDVTLVDDAVFDVPRGEVPAVEDPAGDLPSAHNPDADLPSPDVLPAYDAQSDAPAGDPGANDVLPSDASDASDAGSDAPSPTPPSPVFQQRQFEVNVTRGIVFARGLSHADWNEGPGVPMDLTLDVYEPVDSTATAKPVVVVIHGGGFTGGSSRHQKLSEMATLFAQRGWVGFSIEYRLAKHRGTLPTLYPALPAEGGAGANRLNQWRALYPACRDAKAAIRWIRAHADDYGLHPDYITVIGGSAGSYIAVALGASNEDDCKTEIDAVDDPTLAGTHLDQSSAVATVIDHWGGVAILSMLELIGGEDRFDPTDAPVSIVHGTEDPTVPFTEAEKILAAYQSTGVPHVFYPVEGAGHGPWNARVDGKPLVKLARDFVVVQQALEVQ